MRIRIRTQVAKPMRILADPEEPGKSLKSKKLEFLH